MGIEKHPFLAKLFYFEVGDVSPCFSDLAGTPPPLLGLGIPAENRKHPTLRMGGWKVSRQPPGCGRLCLGRFPNRAPSMSCPTPTRGCRILQNSFGKEHLQSWAGIPKGKQQSWARGSPTSGLANPWSWEQRARPALLPRKSPGWCWRQAENSKAEHLIRLWAAGAPVPPGNPSHKLQAGRSGSQSWKEPSSGWGPMTPPYSYYLGDREGAQALRAFSAHEGQSRGEPEIASIWGSPWGIQPQPQPCQPFASFGSPGSFPGA